MKLNVQRMHPSVKLPVYATDGSGCFDIYAHEAALPHEENTIMHFTGLKLEIPEGHVMLVFSRSGHGFTHNTRLANCVGVIDSDYRGQLAVKLTRDDNTAIEFKEGERIAQALIVPVPKIKFNEVANLSTTQRGEGGFGSTN